MIWLIGYLTIALLVGVITAFLYLRDEEFRESEFLNSAILGTIVGLFWPMTVPLAAFAFAVWYSVRKLIRSLGIETKESHYSAFPPPPPPRPAPPPRQ